MFRKLNFDRTLELHHQILTTNSSTELFFSTQQRVLFSLLEEEFMISDVLLIIYL